MRRTLVEEIRSNNLDEARRIIKELYRDKNIPSITGNGNDQEDARFLANLVELGCEMVAQGAKATIVRGGWEGMVSGDNVMRRITKLHDLEDRTTLMYFADLLMMIAAAIFTDD